MDGAESFMHARGVDPCSLCVYCQHTTPGVRDENCLKCSDCQSFAHFSCLLENVHVPECCLLGDVFYKFTCKSCSHTGVEIVTKEKISWLAAVVIALYNLQEQIYLSQHGYFHWKHHITDYIDRKWNFIFGSCVRRKRTWRGTVSGTLSHYSPMFFQTGSEILRESGWWKLTHKNLSPFKIVQLKLDSGHSSVKKASSKSNSAEEDSVDAGMDHTHAAIQSIPSTSSVTSERDFSSPALDLDLLSYSDSEDLDVDIDLDVNSEEKPFSSVGFPRMESEISDLVDQYVTSEEIRQYSLDNSQYRVDIKASPLNENCESGSESDSSGDNQTAVAPPPKSLFVTRESDTLPWKAEAPTAEKNYVCVPMTEYEELHLLQRLSKHINKPKVNITAEVYRLHRKLTVRREQRHRRLSTFSKVLNCSVNGGMTIATENENIVRTLDRYQVLADTDQSLDDRGKQQSFMLRLLGRIEPTCFLSPYTERLLKPFIRRDYNSKPYWLHLMAHVRDKANSKNPSWRQPQPHPIDYSYVRPQHIPAINSLCELFFWPGIDLSESLHYPDFSCVALYRKIVIGFAFMVPDVGYNESYISFLFTRPEWRRAGVATFMLYHLIQTCMGKDITLHVSATNPAIILYQKFGFKVEELAQDFYDKYLPTDSKECKHALFLRLSR